MAEAKVTETKSAEFDGIVVHGAREHNLKNVSIKIPRNQITVFTGLSGSGKSSLAFDTVYAEGQRRYVESLSNYARNFLDQMSKPDVDSITGLSPAIAIDQRSVATNPRSTVGTVTEIYDYLRLLYAKVGIPECPEHHIPVTSQFPSQIVEDVLQLAEGTKFFILAPVAQGKKGEFLAEFRKWSKLGFLKARVDGQMIDLASAAKLAKTKAHDIELVVDQLIMKANLKSRLSDSINAALSQAKGRVIIETQKGVRKSYSIHASCPKCGYSFLDLEPRLFSYNNPRGACPECNGLGSLDWIEENQFGQSDEGSKKLEKVSYRHRLETSGQKDEEDEIEFEVNVCPSCQGKRLRQEALHVKLGGISIADVAEMSAIEARDWITNLKISEKQKLIAEKIQKQILGRLEYMIQVGCGYLSLSRPANTLSGGEAQRLRLATQVGSALVGVLYVMDEPSIGLHPRDHHRLLKIIGNLRDRGNTIVLVEHDEDTIRFADYVVDLGPRAGRLGGELMAVGSPKEIQANKNSTTGRYLSGELRIGLPQSRRKGTGKFIHLKKASGNNLKKVDLKLPLGTLTLVTGVSGSGKSTLIIDTLYKYLSNYFYKSKLRPSPFEKIDGLENVDKVIDINQRPIGRTPRSTPATYVGLFPLIRDLFAGLPDSRLRGYKPGQFSFNLKGGRCETCQGQGQIKVEMHFLSDVFVNCDACNGRRYNRETLGVKYKEKSIADILNMTVEEAVEFFKHHSQIHRKLETLHRVGLDYMTLGQSSTTLSGGEAQRVKLSKELSKRGTGKTVYILDEPTTGLHFEDVKKLVELLQELVDQGNTVLVIEHNLEVIKVADHVIDLGPDGGNKGGEIVASGTPEEVAKVSKSETGKFLKTIFAIA